MDDRPDRGDAATLDNAAVRARSWEPDEPIGIVFVLFEIVTLRLRRA